MITQIIYDAELDDYILDFGEEMMDQLGWNIGDTIEWIDNGDGSYTLRKQEDTDFDDIGHPDKPL